MIDSLYNHDRNCVYSLKEQNNQFILILGIYWFLVIKTFCQNCSIFWLKWSFDVFRAFPITFISTFLTMTMIRNTKRHSYCIWNSHVNLLHLWNDWSSEMYIFKQYQQNLNYNRILWILFHSQIIYMFLLCPLV